MDLVLPLPLVQDQNTKLFAGSTTVPIPPLRAALGAVVYGQAIIVDAASNGLGLVFSSSVEMGITKMPISPFQSLYSDDSSSSTGFFTLTSNGGLGGLVTKFSGPLFR